MENNTINIVARIRPPNPPKLPIGTNIVDIVYNIIITIVPIIKTRILTNFVIEFDFALSFIVLIALYQKSSTILTIEIIFVDKSLTSSLEKFRLFNLFI